MIQLETLILDDAESYIEQKGVAKVLETTEVGGQETYT